MKLSKIILAAVAFLLEYRHRLFQALLIPSVLFIAVDYLHMLPLNRQGHIVLNVLGTFIETLILVTVHRMILLGPKAVPRWGLGWGRRESIFLINLFTLLLMVLGVILVPMLVMAALHVEGVFILVLSSMFAIYIFMRLYMVFPAIAIDQSISFRQAWSLTVKHQALMFFVVVLFPVLLLIPVVLLLYIPYLEYLADVVALLGIILGVAVVSVAYKAIMECENRQAT